jgi:hypothetical protein
MVTQSSIQHVHLPGHVPGHQRGHHAIAFLQQLPHIAERMARRIGAATTQQCAQHGGQLRQRAAHGQRAEGIGPQPAQFHAGGEFGQAGTVEHGHHAHPVVVRRPHGERRMKERFAPALRVLTGEQPEFLHADVPLFPPLMRMRTR